MSRDARPAETVSAPTDCGRGACETSAPRPRFSFQAWLEVGRVSNLPTTWSNVLTGVALAGADPLAVWPDTLALMLLGSLFYVGGMAMNDAVDAATDARERRGRPIPSGRVRRCDVKKFATVALTLATGLSAAFGWRAFGCALGLTAAILAYNLLHGRVSGSRALMGACRGLLVVLACVAIGDGIDLRGLAFAALLALYTADLTWFAEHEVAPDRNRPAARAQLVGLLGVVPLGAALAWAAAPDWRFVWASGAALSLWLGWTIVAWLRRGGARVRTVMAAIAGMSLVDAYFLCLLNRPGAGLAAAACFVLTVAFQRRVAGS